MDAVNCMADQGSLLCWLFEHSDSNANPMQSEDAGLTVCIAVLYSLFPGSVSGSNPTSFFSSIYDLFFPDLIYVIQEETLTCFHNEMMYR